MREVGLAIIGQTGDLVPADKKLYALRDVTATVDIVPLIASSIMSKKIAAGADAIVLDVKVGDGAFMKTLDDARVLAEAMLELGAPRRRARSSACSPTWTSRSGAAVGNALEMREAVDDDRGDGPADFTELVLDACARLLALSDLGIDEDEGRRRAEAAVADGSALAAYERWIRAQGGDPDLGRARTPRRSSARCPRRATASSSRLGALAVGIAALELGAGRRTKDDDDRPRGRRRLPRKKRGDAVAAGEALAEVHARDESVGGRRGRRGARRRTRSATSRRARTAILLDVVE